VFKEVPIVDKYYHKSMEVKFISENKGHGVFLLEHVPKHTIVEVAPVIVYHKDIHTQGRELARFGGCGTHHVHVIESYAFDFDFQRGMCCISMGYGGMYNHSYNPALVVKKQKSPIKALIFTSLRDLEPGDELTHAYSRWDDGLPFEPEIEDVRTIGNQGMGSFEEWVDKRRGVGVNLEYFRAHEIIREEEHLDRIKDDRPRLGSWLKSSKTEDEE
jgi:uncharacterized protein